MRYRYKFKGTKTEREQEKSKGSFSARTKMLFLIGWSVVAIGIYLASTKYFAITPVVISEVLILLALCGYFINEFRIRGLVKKGDADSKKILKMQDVGKLLLIFTIPLVFILGYDFIVTTLNSFVK